MKNIHVFCAFALASLGIAGCGSDASGTYKGEATEDGTVKVAHMAAPAVATNEAPPRKLTDQTVTISKSGEGYSVKFRDCEMKGKESSPGLIVVSNDCDVKVTNYEGKLPLSATVKIGEGGAVTMDVTGTAKKSEEAVVNYNYTFKGAKQ
ncbi:hypothetical protein [Polyangium aurulentum]|uniref:hypothetical protein n=1 Tax=Polyangium aurulentum TaxID=2567896 RepID=UPI0010ADC1A2|nr:hypothetical protein [Polyangium aurulentum]UQA59710.1 hypothetical protein E8A73_004175 [Polyangium aurulentum]